MEPDEWTAKVLYGGLVVTAMLPLTALMFGTSVLGDELEDGTAVYLLTKPCLAGRFSCRRSSAPWLLTSALVGGAALIAGFIAIQDGDTGVVIGAAVGFAAGALAYIALFVLLSLLTNHALIVGLLYVFIWEGALAGVFEGIRYISIRHYTLGLAEWLGDAQPSAFEAYLSGTTALVMTAITIVIAAVIAVRKLEEIEVRETT